MIADPLWSCVMLLCGPLWVFCGSFVVLCGPLWVLCGPLRSFAVFSHTPKSHLLRSVFAVWSLGVSETESFRDSWRCMDIACMRRVDSTARQIHR